MLNKSDARVKTYVTDVLKKNKSLTEREVKAAVRRGLKLGRAPLSAGVIREVRRKLGIDRPRAIAYTKNLLAKNPTLEAKKLIEDVGERFGIRLQAPDVSRLRPAGARRKKTAAAKTCTPAREEGPAVLRGDLGHLRGQGNPGGRGALLPVAGRVVASSRKGVSKLRNATSGRKDAGPASFNMSNKQSYKNDTSTPRAEGIAPKKADDSLVSLEESPLRPDFPA